MEVHTSGNAPSSCCSPSEALLLLLIRAELETFPLLRLILPFASCPAHSPGTAIKSHKEELSTRPLWKSLLHLGSALTQRESAV